MNERELERINQTQDYYESILIDKMFNPRNVLKTINFTSPTGTGKTKMMADIINKIGDDCFFLITTLSKGQLKFQIEKEIKRHTIKTNFIVYGVSDYTKNTIIQADDILGLLPLDKNLIWFRDEGHIASNRWMEILEEKCFRIINFSATNDRQSDDDVQCNFNHTMMLRTVIQHADATPSDAIKKLLEVKKQHKSVKNYNPCAIFRVLDEGDILDSIIHDCNRYGLKYINITEEDYNMSELCMDDSEYDVIINKFKIVEGIDIRRAHVLYMTNEPHNPATTIQVIGRCRRNALLYRDDIDILSPKNSKLLEDTKYCYVYYNVSDMNIDEDEEGNLVSAFCDTISVQQLRPNISIHLHKGRLQNGLFLEESSGKSGEFEVVIDKDLGFNVLDPTTDFYAYSKEKNMYCFYDDVLDEEYLEKNWFKYHTQLGLIYANYSYKTVLAKVETKIYKKEVEDDYNYVYFSYDNMEEQYNVSFIEQRRSSSTWINSSLRSVSIVLTKHFAYKMSDELKEKVKVHLERKENFEIEIDREIPVTIGEYVNGLLIYKKYDYVSKDTYITLLNGFIEEKKAIIPFDKNGNQLDYSQCKTTRYYNKMQEYLNDYETSVIGFDLMKPINKGKVIQFIEDSSVTSKISKNSKLNIYLSKKYNDLLEQVSRYYYIEKQNYDFSKKLNSMLGFVTEYCAKLKMNYDLPNVDYKDRDIKRVENKPRGKEAIMIRRAILIYKNQMQRVYGSEISKRIPTLTVWKLLDSKYDSFISMVHELSERTVNVINALDIKKDEYLRYSDLSVRHIRGLADFIDDKTILDLKCTGSINEKHIKQVLAYYYLAKKKNMEIENIVVYDAVLNRYIKINMNTHEIVTNY